MTESTIPATEAALDQKDVVNYELAFHVLPTVAEGEVTDVFTNLKALVAAAGGTLTAEEAPQRFELAYPIVKSTEGKNRTYKSGYFGWVRFTALPNDAPAILAEMEARTDILRALLVKLTPAEIAHPFVFHEALATKRVVNLDETEDSSESDTDDESSEVESSDDDTKEDAETVEEKA